MHTETKKNVSEHWSEEKGHEITIRIGNETIKLPCKEAFDLADEILKFEYCGVRNK
jgi:hypothetical protein